MKRVRVIIHEPSINKVIGSELHLQLDDKASVVDAINEVDKVLKERGGFPLAEYQSLLHMIYNPVENRFYKQVAVAAYKDAGDMINLRADPKQTLPVDIAVVLIPTGGCISEWEEAIDFQEFSRALQGS